jgi:hypothetical protein
MHKLTKRNSIIGHISDPMSSSKKTKDEIMQDIINYLRLFKAYKHIISDSANEPPTFIKVANEKRIARSHQRHPLKSFELTVSQKMFGTGVVAGKILSRLNYL